MPASRIAASSRKFLHRASPLIALGCAALLSSCGGEAMFFLSSMGDQTRLPNGTQIVDDIGGRTNYGDIQCDQNGRYLGGGSPQSEQAVKTGLERSIDDAKNELNDIRRAIDICKGSQKGMEDYKAQFGCDESRIDQLAREAEAANSKVWPLETQISQLAAAVERSNDRLRNEKNLSGAERSRLIDQINRDTGRQLLLELEARPLREEARRRDAARWQMYNACDKARDAAWADPCFTPNVTEMFESRRSLEQRIRRDEQRLDRFKDCSEDRIRQAQSSAPSRTGDAVVPGLILQQVLPGLLVPPRHHPSGHPPPRDHQHSDDHWQDHKK